jgi:hypothetical protein
MLRYLFLKMFLHEQYVDTKSQVKMILGIQTLVITALLTLGVAFKETRK